MNLEIQLSASYVELYNVIVCFVISYERGK